MKKYIRSTYLAIILLLVYLPIFIFMMFSFNSSGSVSKMTGLSLKWYENFFHNEPFILSIILSLIIGIIVTLVSLIIGIMASIGLTKSSKITKKMTLSISNIPLINADVVTAVSLMLLFLTFSFSFGFVTLIFSHISFDIPYVILIILPRLKKIDNELIESSTDLGAKPSYTLFKIILPILKPAIISAAVIAFTMSFDDFIISYFTGGATNNVATYIYSLKIVEPYVNAFGTMIIVVIASVVIFWNIIRVYKNTNMKKLSEIIKNVYKDEYLISLENKLILLYKTYNLSIRLDIPVNLKLEKKIKSIELKIAKEKKYINKMKIKLQNKRIKEDEAYKKEINSNNKFIYVLKRIWKQTLFIAISLSSFSLLTSAYVINSHYDINLATWGEYFPNDFIQKFEDETGYKVKVNLFDSNESLYNKIQTYKKYDIMVPSAYMALKLANNNYLQPIDYTRLSKDKGKFFTSWKDFWGDGSSSSDGVIDPLLSEAVANTIAKHTESTLSEDLRKYQIPYYWGDIRLIYNTSKDPELSNLGKINPKLKTDFNDSSDFDEKFTHFSKDLSWQDFKNFAIANSKNENNEMVLSDDPKNVFITDSEIKNNWVEPYTSNSVNTVCTEAINWLRSKNVSLQNDEITNSFDSGNFNFALAYNGDILTEMCDIPDLANDYIVTYPSSPIPGTDKTTGTDIWEDGLVLNKNLKNSDAVYKFLNYIINNQVYLYETNDLVYTSPFTSDEKQIIKILSDSDWFSKLSTDSQKNIIQAYQPIYYNKTEGDPLTEGSGFFWYNKTDAQMQSKYNELIASKSL